MSEVGNYEQDLCEGNTGQLTVLRLQNDLSRWSGVPIISLRFV